MIRGLTQLRINFHRIFTENIWHSPFWGLQSGFSRSGCVCVGGMMELRATLVCRQSYIKKKQKRWYFHIPPPSSYVYSNNTSQLGIWNFKNCILPFANFFPFFKKIFLLLFSFSTFFVENADCTSAVEYDLPPNQPVSWYDAKLHRMVMLQFRRFEEYGVSFYCYDSLVPPWPGELVTVEWHL